MNKLSPNIPNRIKQPSKCCVYCGKSYIKKTSLDKHVVLCELLNNSKNTIVENDEDIPSQKKMYQILLELGNKFNKLEEKVDELNKWVVKKKKKINVIEWLNTNITPEIKFDSLIEKITITQEDVKYLFDNSFADTLNEIFSRNIYNLSESEYPIFAFIQKSNVFYIYENEEAGWMELNREKNVKFLNRVHMKLLRAFGEYKKANANKIREDESFSLLCDKTSVKMMNVDFRQETILGKIKGNMYSRMKTDMKALVEYEFEF
jgi:tyrosine-protein phosphatase YwqE